ncbi:MAG: hypothetical protein ACJA07_002112 [Rhodococcus sp. (in: high G+C Gram-positive bacteria)]|mgnify:FL=1|jgi:hypothetical protein
MIDIPSDMDSVVKRWYPAGVDLVAAARRAEPAGVFVTGMPGSGVTTVATELDAMAETNLGAPLERAREVDSAAAVLFVVDASAPLGRRALTDLAPALHSTTVAIAVNKTDVHRDWRAVHEVIAQSVAEHVPRAVDVTLWPISAKLAERARIAIDPRMRSALLEESGFEDVLAHLVRALSQSQSLLRDRKYNAAVHAAAAGARHEIVDKARAVTSGATTVALRSERARLADMRDRARTDRATALRSRLQLTRSELVHDLGQSIRQFSTAARESIDAANRAELTHLQQHLGEQLQQAASQVEDRLGDRLRAIDADLELAAELPAPPEAASEQPGPSPRRRGVEDKMMILLGASAGVGLGRIAMSPIEMVPALDIAVVPVSLVLGALCAWWLVRSRRLVADRAHLRAWVAEAAVSTKSAVEQSALGRILAAESVFFAASHQSARASAAAAESELERVEAELRAAAEQRAAVLAACDRDLMALERGLEKFDLPARTEPTGPRARLSS